MSVYVGLCQSMVVYVIHGQEYSTYEMAAVRPSVQRHAAWKGGRKFTEESLSTDPALDDGWTCGARAAGRRFGEDFYGRTCA